MCQRVGGELSRLNSYGSQDFPLTVQLDVPTVRSNSQDQTCVWHWGWQVMGTTSRPAVPLGSRFIIRMTVRGCVYMLVGVDKTVNTQTKICHIALFCFYVCSRLNGRERGWKLELSHCRWECVLTCSYPRQHATYRAMVVFHKAISWTYQPLRSVR